MLDRIAIRDVPLFSRLSPAHIQQVQQLMRFTVYQPGEVVLEEGAPSACLLFVIIEGEAALCKRARCPFTDKLRDYEIEVRGKHEIFGWISVLDARPLPLTVKAKTPLTVAIVDFKPGGPGSPANHIRNVLVSELRRYLASYVRTSLEERVVSLQHEAEFARYRAALGSIVITTLALISFYTLSLSMLPRFQSLLEVNFAVTPLIIIFFGAFYLPVIERSGFPPSFFGLRTDNWRNAVSFAITASLALIVIMAFIKWLLIATLPALHGLQVMSFSDVIVAGKNDTNTYWYWVALCLYMLLTPVQEFVARCGVQAPLYAFLQGSEFRRASLSIVVSNLIFSAVHAHIGFAFALVAFIPGLFWGWIFLRTNSLIAASVSHLIIGGAGIFLFGIEEFAERLM